MPPAKVEDLLAEIARGADVAVGSRFVEGGGVRIIHGSGDTLMAYLMSRILNGFIRRVLGRGLPRLHLAASSPSAATVLRRRSRCGAATGNTSSTSSTGPASSGSRSSKAPTCASSGDPGVGKTGQKFGDFIRKGWKYVWLTVKLRFTRIR